MTEADANQSDSEILNGAVLIQKYLYPYCLGFYVQIKKRGEGFSTLVFLGMVSIIVAVFVFIAIPAVAKAYASGKIALKAASSRDIALLLDAMYSSPFDSKVEYNVDLSDFKVEVSNNEVKVESLSLSVDPKASKYPFVPINDNPTFIISKPKKIVFEKKAGKLNAVGVP